MQRSDGPDLMIWPWLEAHLTNFVVIRTHLSCHFHHVVDFLGLRRNGFSSQVINQGQDLQEQVSRHRNLGQLERGVPTVTERFRKDIHQLSRNLVSDQWPIFLVNSRVRF